MVTEPDQGSPAAPAQDQDQADQSEQSELQKVRVAAQAEMVAAIAEFASAFALEIAQAGGVINALAIAAQQAVENERLNCLVNELVATNVMSDVSFVARFTAKLRERTSAMGKVQIATDVRAAMRKKGN